jgi:hypothetical protein
VLPEDESCEFNELFKLYLDPQYDDPLGIAPSIHQAQQWFRDHMQSLHTFLEKYFEETVPRFDLKRIEYVFSMPATWKDPALIAAMERLIIAAGYGQTGFDQRIMERRGIHLTEAEAAAAYAIRRMEQNEVFLVCDAGQILFWHLCLCRFG